MAAGREQPPRRVWSSGCASSAIRIPDPAVGPRAAVAAPQARIAPIDRLLAAREAAEDEEVDDLYKRSTGDAETDRLLRDIRKEERSHSLAVAEMRGGATPVPRTRRRGEARHGGGSRARAGVPGELRQGPRAAEKWHRIRRRAAISARSTAPTTGSRPSSGSSPGSRARPAARLVLTAGLAGAIASALSMATGAFLAERSEAEVAAANVERERRR